MFMDLYCFTRLIRTANTNTLLHFKLSSTALYFSGRFGMYTFFVFNSYKNLKNTVDLLLCCIYNDIVACWKLFYVCNETYCVSIFF